MIATLSGRVSAVEADSLIIEVGGVGMRVFSPVQLIDTTQTGDVVSVHTHLIVRETELSLYGFETKEERDYFNLLIGVSGIGPRLGVAILSTLNPNSIRRAIFNEQHEVFSSVSGIGKKTAQKISLHLQDRLPDGDGLEPVSQMDDKDGEVLEALTALGYSVIEAQAAIQTIPKDAGDEVEERLKLALAYFNPPG